MPEVAPSCQCNDGSLLFLDQGESWGLTTVFAILQSSSPVPFTRSLPHAQKTTTTPSPAPSISSLLSIDHRFGYVDFSSLFSPRHLASSSSRHFPLLLSCIESRGGSTAVLAEPSLVHPPPRPCLSLAKRLSPSRACGSPLRQSGIPGFPLNPGAWHGLEVPCVGCVSGLRAASS